MKRILILTGDGGEGYESWYAIHRFREEGFEPVVAAPSKRRLHMVLHDFEEGWDTYIEKPGYGVVADATVAEVSADNFDAVLVIGGRAPEYLRHNAHVIALIRAFDEQEKWLFSICHGIQVLNAAGAVKGRKVTCYEHVRSEVEQCGGEWLKPQAVRDGRIVTAQTWESHPEFYREVMACLRS